MPLCNSKQIFVWLAPIDHEPTGAFPSAAKCLSCFRSSGGAVACQGSFPTSECIWKRSTGCPCWLCRYILGHCQAYRARSLARQGYPSLESTHISLVAGMATRSARLSSPLGALGSRLPCGGHTGACHRWALLKHDMRRILPKSLNFEDLAFTSILTSFASHGLYLSLIFDCCDQTTLLLTNSRVDMPPRPLRPKDEPGTLDGPEDAPESKSNKRRAVSSACIPCRKRKSKVRHSRRREGARVQAYHVHSVTAHCLPAQLAQPYIEQNAATTQTAITDEREP